MKKTNPFYRFCALALSCLLLISLLPVTQVLADGDGAIHIKSAEDLRSLAHSCTLDSWSRGKTVVLDNDIELTDDDTLPIPTFGGTFNGNGHTISGLSITQSVSPAGLFGVLQKDAVIKNLNVEGTVTPSGDSENIGGIVGENHGTIESCTFNGSVSGKRSVGGIAGRNLATGIGRAGVQSKVSTVAERSFSSKAIWEAEAVSSRVSRTGSLSCSYGSHSQAHWPSAKRVSSDRLHANFIFFITVFFVVADTVRNLPDTFLSDPPGGGDEGF